MPQTSITKISLKIMYLKDISNELSMMMSGHEIAFCITGSSQKASNA